MYIWCLCQFARVVKGVDLRSTAGNCAWVRTPQLTCFKTKQGKLVFKASAHTVVIPATRSRCKPNANCTLAGRARKHKANILFLMTGKPCPMRQISSDSEAKRHVAQLVLTSGGRLGRAQKVFRFRESAEVRRRLPCWTCLRKEKQRKLARLCLDVLASTCALHWI